VKQLASLTLVAVCLAVFSVGCGDNTTKPADNKQGAPTRSIPEQKK
jgi:hypothetical protein